MTPVWRLTLTAFRGRDGSVSTSGPPRGSDAPSSTLTWPAMSGRATSKQARDGMVNLRPLSAHRRGRLGTRGGAQHHRLDDESKDLPVICVEDNAQLTLKHLALILQQSECRRRGRRCRYARRLASPHAPGRHLHLFTVNLGASARCLEIVHSISTIRHSARLFGTIAPYSAWRHPLST